MKMSCSGELPNIDNGSDRPHAIDPRMLIGDDGKDPATGAYNGEGRKNCMKRRHVAILTQRPRQTVK